jgi:hypothetical protein
MLAQCFIHNLNYRYRQSVVKIRGDTYTFDLPRARLNCPIYQIFLSYGTRDQNQSFVYGVNFVEILLDAAWNRPQ